MKLQILLLIAWLPVYLTMSPRGGLSRCRCINSTTKIRPKHLENIEVSPPISSCNLTEIIVTVKSNRKCLNPNTTLGKIVTHCWDRNKNNFKNLKRCVNKKWKPPHNKSKNQRRKKRKREGQA
ncbi:growth-regulated alpha protein-like [Rhinoderma darwinii]|uniref:growth-regulated alpha protein-like n=1 Tax=Rhinoderma darwinii TaxID=43563 RepID=UPI003F66F404